MSFSRSIAASESADGDERQAGREFGAEGGGIGAAHLFFDCGGPRGERLLNCVCGHWFAASIRSGRRENNFSR